MLEPRRLTLVTESWVEGLVAPLRQRAADTLGAGVLEVQDANSVANIPGTAALGANSYDDSSGFVRWYYRQLGPKLAVDDLEIRVAETGGVHLDKKLIVLDSGDVNCNKLIRLVILPSC
jgi:hypothetical protein